MKKHKSHDGHKENYAHLGVEQGNMSAHVEDYQLPDKDFAEEGFSGTTNYIARQDKHQSMNASQIKKQHYQGRYS